ncbi:MAG: AbrB/MazE/SpoVT family DNA-binding domain-containing protein [Firmicutes bacterium]|jgi:transcriptional pleiotropic regulator of transition state genes|nr:AbrB/MazE/SpoVT family DNA-binding domain-containing protein [Bacillota bacterium]
MRSTGIVRKVDTLGRIVIPMDLRRNLEIGENDPVAIYVDGENVVLKKFKPFCTFCGSTEDVRTFKDKHVCASCLQLAKNVS